MIPVEEACGTTTICVFHQTLDFHTGKLFKLDLFCKPVTPSCLHLEVKEEHVIETRWFGVPTREFVKKNYAVKSKTTCKRRYFKAAVETAYLEIEIRASNIMPNSFNSFVLKMQFTSLNALNRLFRPYSPPQPSPNPVKLFQPVCLSKSHVRVSYTVLIFVWEEKCFEGYRASSHDVTAVILVLHQLCIKQRVFVYANIHACLRTWCFLDNVKR